MAFGHLAQRRWLPLETRSDLHPYRLPAEILGRIRPDDVIAGFLHRACVLLLACRGHWHRRDTSTLQDWFYGHLIAHCVVLWLAVHGKVQQRSASPWHLFFEYPSTIDAGQFKSFSRDEQQEDEKDAKEPGQFATAGQLGACLRACPRLTLGTFVLTASFWILRSIGPLLVRKFQRNKSQDGEPLVTIVVAIDLADTEDPRGLRSVLQNAWSHPRSNWRIPRNLAAYQFTAADREEPLLLTHYAGSSLLAFWGQKHARELTRSMERSIDRELPCYTWAGWMKAVAKFAQSCFVREKKTIGPLRAWLHWEMVPFAQGAALEASLRVVGQMLMLCSGQPPHPVYRFLAGDAKQIDATAPGNGRSAVRPRTLLVDALLCRGVSILRRPELRVGLFCYARDAIERQVMVLGARQVRCRPSDLKPSTLLPSDGTIPLRLAREMHAAGFVARVSSFEEFCIKKFSGD